MISIASGTPDSFCGFRSHFFTGELNFSHSNERVRKSVQMFSPILREEPINGIEADLVDELLMGYERPENIIGENGLLRRLTKALLERTLTEAGALAHLGWGLSARIRSNSRNVRGPIDCAQWTTRDAFHSRCA